MSIVLKDLSKRFGQTMVVNRLSLEIAEGELFVLLGGSGSGKSTILRLIAGLSQVDSGRIEVNGRDVTFQPPQSRGVGFVFQNYSIFRHMTASQNIEFGLRIRRVSQHERKQRSSELLELVGLTGLGARYPAQLSGGQQQRVALARALAYQPEVLLLDEPFGALDVKIRAQLRESLKQIQRQLGVTTILVTHDQEEAFELADRIGLVERGFLIEVGTPEALYHHPQTEFAATFVGGGNVLVGRQEGSEIQLGSVSLPFPPGAPTHDPGAPVRILFRPETVMLQETPFEEPSRIRTLGQGRVVGEIFTGPFRRLRLELEGLRGVRPLVPAPNYGQPATQIDAHVPSSGVPNVDQLLWVGLTDYHVLVPTGLKVLIGYDGKPAGEAAAVFGLRLAEAARGPTTLLVVLPHADSTDQNREEIEALPHRWGAGDNPRLKTLIRQGTPHREILSEAQDGVYEVVILGHSSDSDQAPAGLGSSARRILAQTEVPVLLAKFPHDRLERILICTAAGEPGKSVLRFAGRLARATGAVATILHVLNPQAPPSERARAERHLSRAQATLNALGVRNEVKLAQGEPVKQILSQAERGNYDLVVIGAPAPRAHRRLVWSDLTTQIVSGTTCPVAVVPMSR
jgi:sulfate transport system ATP-binding protein